MKTLFALSSRLFKLGVPISIMAILLMSVIGVGVISSPVNAQASSGGIATKDLAFSLVVSSGVEPVASIEVEARGFCLPSEGVATSKATVSARLSVVSHEQSITVCIHDIHIAFPGFTNCIATVAKQGSRADISRASSGTVNTRTFSVKSQGSVSYETSNPIGALKAIDGSGNDIAGGGSLSNLIITVRGCTLPTATYINSFFIVNAEPSSQVFAGFETLGGCRGSFGKLANENIAPKLSETVILDSTCVWVLKFADFTRACSALALVYISGTNAPITIVGSSSTPQEVGLTASFNGVFHDAKKVHTIVLQKSSRCSTSLRVSLKVTAPTEFAATVVQFRIVPTNSTQVDDCSDTTVDVTARTQGTVFLRRRGRLSSVACSYAYIIPQLSGGLQLGPAEPLRHDITFSSTGRFSATIDYTSIRLPVQISSNFPASASFTNEDRVSYRISSPPTNCGSVLGSLGPLTAGIGVLRHFQAIPGEVKLLGNNADTRASSGPFIYFMPPSLNKLGNFGSQTETFCTVRVSVSGVPRGCLLNSNKAQEVTATSSTKSFDFRFDYSCGTEVFNLRQGWNLVPYSGSTGASPSTLLSSTLDGKVRSVFAWDASGQNWKGFGGGNADSLSALTRGEALFMYAPVVAQVALKSLSVFSAVSGAETGIALKPGLNMITYRGSSQTAASAFDNTNVTAVFRWSSVSQAWNNYYRVAQSGTNLRPLSTVNHGDVLFVYSVATSDFRIAY